MINHESESLNIFSVMHDGAPYYLTLHEVHRNREHTDVSGESLVDALLVPYYNNACTNSYIFRHSLTEIHNEKVTNLMLINSGSLCSHASSQVCYGGSVGMKRYIRYRFR